MGQSFGVWLLGAAGLVAGLADRADAQYFGRNKVHYDRSDMRMLVTEHFDIYHAEHDAAAALTAARLAERWYLRLSKALDHSLAGRQPIILYGSHRRFEQTNVHAGLIDESTGGFTDSRKRRIVLPFAASLAETDHVLGHELVHAFQFDIASQHRTGLAVPLWFIEGMAEYLTLGADDPQTAMWMRDAVRAEKLPSIKELSSPRYFPYRWGAALWAHLAQRFGADLPAKALRTKRGVSRRLETLTGEPLDQLTASWHESLRTIHPVVSRPSESGRSRPLISRSKGGGRLNLAASISPDGRRMIFLSERDQFSIDLFLADAETGAVIRKLITTTASADFESLQYLHSAGSWNRPGTRFALATIRQGRPALVLLNLNEETETHEIRLAALDEVYSPSWSPDGHAIVFSAMKGGATDLHAIDLATSRVTQLTDDPFADLQPAWSPDGRTVAFTTDRFTTDLEHLRFGHYRVGLLDVQSGAIVPAPSIADANQLDPAWSPDGSSLFCVADRDGVRDVFRLVPADGAIYQVTNVETGVSGVTQLSPALSVSATTGTLAYSLFRRSGYEIHTITAAGQLVGTRLEPGAAVTDAEQGPADLQDQPLEPAPALFATSRAADAIIEDRPKYEPRLSLEAFGSPYFSAGGGAFGSYVQGGTSLLFGDLLRDRQLLTAVHVNSRLDESSFGVLYVNRSSRWNWGLTVEQAPDVRLRSRGVREDPERQDVLLRDRERIVRTHRQVGGFVAYPLNRSQRLELSAGVRQITVGGERRTQTLSAITGRLIDEVSEALAAGPSVGLVEAGLALVGDTAVFGATAPLIGSRYRFQITPAVGGLTYTSILADYRTYLMPVRPYTIALRLAHSGRYGADSGDALLREGYVGSSTLVRGYGASAVARSECGGRTSDCPMLNELLGTSVAAAKLELRVPVFGAFSSRVRYGPLPIDAFAFVDAGVAWGGEQHLFGPGGTASRVIRSVGAGVRANVLGLIFEFTTVRPLDLTRAGWSFGFNMRPGF